MKYLMIFSISFLLFGCSPESESMNQNQLELDSVESPQPVEQIDHNWSNPDLDTEFFDTGSFLYWQNNSDSAWLTFENSQGQKTILNSDYIGYWDRLGTLFRK